MNGPNRSALPSVCVNQRDTSLIYGVNRTHGKQGLFLVFTALKACYNLKNDHQEVVPMDNTLKRTVRGAFSPDGQTATGSEA